MYSRSFSLRNRCNVERVGINMSNYCNKVQELLILAEYYVDEAAASG
jgi:hypothetical protein